MFAGWLSLSAATLPPREEGFPALEALCVQVVTPMVAPSRLDDDRRDVDE